MKWIIPVYTAGFVVSYFIYQHVLIPFYIKSALLATISSLFVLHCVADRLNLTRNPVTKQSSKLYADIFSGDKKGGKKTSYETDTAVLYYNIVTDWYEAAWGESFQLGGAQGFAGEPTGERFRRHEYWLASQAGIKKGQRWLDLGCGVGGPMRHIARFTEAKIVGVNLNKLQLSRAIKYNEESGLSSLCSAVFCDFAKLEEEFFPSSIDGAFALEAVCHAADKLACFKSLFNVLKPGGVYACYEWVLTSRFDPKNEDHLYYKRSVEIFGGVASLSTEDELLSLLEEAGFTIEKKEDMSLRSHIYPEPWYKRFDPQASIANFGVSKIGIRVMRYFLSITELCSLIPAGSTDAHRTITSGLEGTMLGGKTGVFTPAFFVKAVKPSIKA